MSANDLNNTSRTNWKALESMSDDDIDYSDIPPLTDDFFERATLQVPADQNQNLVQVNKKFKPRRKSHIERIQTKIKWNFHPHRNWFASLNKIGKTYFLGNLIAYVGFLSFFLIGVSYFHDFNFKLVSYFLFIVFIFPILKLLRIKTIKIFNPKNVFYFLFKQIKFLYLKFKKFVKKENFYIILGLLFAVIFLCSFLIFEAISEISFKYLLLFGATLCFFSLLIEVVSFLRTNIGSDWFRTTLKVIGAVASFVSLIISREYINSITHINPLQIPVALTLISALMLPVIWIFLAYFILLIVFMSMYVFLPSFMMLLMVFHPYVIWFNSVSKEIRKSYLFRFIFRKSNIRMEDQKRRVNNWNLINIWMGRSIGVAFCLAMLLQVNSTFPWIGESIGKYETSLSKNLVQSMVFANYQASSSECTNVNQGERIALIGDKKISVAIPDKMVGYKFTVRNCQFP
jgi:hypothetical protein